MRGMRGQGALTALRRVDGETGTARAYLQGATEVTLAGVAVVVDCDGALYWPDEGVLAIADLHLEKGSSFAARGVPCHRMIRRRRWHGLCSASAAACRAR